jgi:crotonobetainyl-CoA:carnitine CoA-transferase CaiB-like acyl-CoA transferase
MERLAEALRRRDIKQKPRIATRVTRSANERRLVTKRVASLKKRIRRSHPESD